MSNHASHKLKERGTVKSYVIGFILSLIFTFIPYYLVQNNVGGGNILLIAILSLALVQLIIQIVFFLHLGRGPKPRWELYFFVSTVGLILVVVGGSIVIVNNLHKNMSIQDQQKKLVNEEAIYQINGELTGACQTTGANHEIILRNGPASPRHTSADLCDTLTFVNEDNENHHITFGTHPEHGSYGGDSKLELRPKKTKTITLSETGTFNFHDHDKPYIGGSFSVLSDDQSY